MNVLVKRIVVRSRCCVRFHHVQRVVSGKGVRTCIDNVPVLDTHFCWSLVRLQPDSVENELDRILGQALLCPVCFKDLLEPASGTVCTTARAAQIEADDPCDTQEDWALTLWSSSP